MRRSLVALLVIVLPASVLGGCSSDSDSEGATVSVEVKDVADSDVWTLTATPDSVPAGKVTFDVENKGTIEHEMVILKTETAADALAVDSEDRVDEESSIGEVSEFAAGGTKSLTIEMAEGSYVLLCNIAGHYAKGMRTAFTVT